MQAVMLDVWDLLKVALFATPLIIVAAIIMAAFWEWVLHDDYDLND